MAIIASGSRNLSEASGLSRKIMTSISDNDMMDESIEADFKYEKDPWLKH